MLRSVLMNLKIAKYLESKREKNKQNLQVIRKKKASLLRLSADEIDLGYCGLYMQWRIASRIAQTRRGDGRETRIIEHKYMKSFRLNTAVLFVSDLGNWQREGLAFNVEKLFSIKYRDVWNYTSSDYEKKFEELWRY